MAQRFASVPSSHLDANSVARAIIVETMLSTIFGFIVLGLVAGLIARILVPGRDSLGCTMTIGLGIAGSFVGGFLGRIIFGTETDQGFLQASGIVGSIIGAIIVLLLYRKLVK